MFSNNGYHECKERLEEGIILILISGAQGAYFEAQGAYFEVHKLGGKAYESKLWIVRKMITSLI